MTYLFFTSRTINGESQKPEEPVEIMMGIWGADALYNKDEFLEFVENKLNIKIIPVNLSWDNWQEELQKRKIKGELPDIFVNDIIGNRSYYEWIEDGDIIEITQKLDDYPALKEYMEDPYVQNLENESGELICNTVYRI